MKIGIATDSTADIPAELVELHRIAVVPSILIIEGREHIDGQDITREEFYAHLPEYQIHPTTAAPSIGDFGKIYDRMFSQGCDRIVSIHAAAQLTAIVNVARQAALDFADKVTCIDSGSLTMGLGFQVLAAAEQTDLGLQAVLDAVESTRRRLQVNAALDTLEYLKRSGRVPGAVAALGGLLSIKPVIELLRGEVKPIGAARTASQAEERIFELLLKQGELERLAILHTNAEARAKKLLERALEQARKSLPREILIVNLTAVVGAHLGPNGIGFAAVRK